MAPENQVVNDVPRWKTSPEGASVDVCAGITGGMARISVRDYGHGVPHQLHRRLWFGPDHRRSSVRLYDGRISAENVHPLSPGLNPPAESKAARKPAAPAHSG
jgi:hypothetical protein